MLQTVAMCSLIIQHLDKINLALRLVPKVGQVALNGLTPALMALKPVLMTWPPPESNGYACPSLGAILSLMLLLAASILINSPWLIMWLATSLARISI